LIPGFIRFSPYRRPNVNMESLCSRAVEFDSFKLMKKCRAYILKYIENCKHAKQKCWSHFKGGNLIRWWPWDNTKRINFPMIWAMNSESRQCLNALGIGACIHCEWQAQGSTNQMHSCSRIVYEDIMSKPEYLIGLNQLAAFYMVWVANASANGSMRMVNALFIFHWARSVIKLMLFYSWKEWLEWEWDQVIAVSYDKPCLLQ